MDLAVVVILAAAAGAGSGASAGAASGTAVVAAVAAVVALDGILVGMLQHRGRRGRHESGSLGGWAPRRLLWTGGGGGLWRGCQEIPRRLNMYIMGVWWPAVAARCEGKSKQGGNI